VILAPLVFPALRSSQGIKDSNSLSIMTESKMIFIIMTQGIMIFSMMTQSIMTQVFSIMTLRV
jgi:hypothetical protein